jgi:hypothetical protein
LSPAPARRSALALAVRRGAKILFAIRPFFVREALICPD